MQLFGLLLASTYQAFNNKHKGSEIMVEMTKREILYIYDGRKWLTIRRFRKNGTMPFKQGTKTYLKIGRTKARYGRIEITEVIAKPLSQMTDEDAFAGGYECAEDYINDHLTKYNTEADLDEVMLFYRFNVLWMDEELINGLRREAEEVA